VILGDMRLVGPRPEVPEHVIIEDPTWMRVLEIKPGLTDPVTQLLRDEENVLAEAGKHWALFYAEALQPFKLNGYLAYQHRRTAWSDVVVLGITIAAVVRLPGTCRRPADVYQQIGRVEKWNPPSSIAR
jgi:lipopolysaccharide/colanic/teichoic acid biosynthesis glycosyltransferase